MLLALSSVLLVLFAHWFSDFVMQTQWMATNKSSSNVALGAHVGVYCVCMFFILLAIMSPVVAATYVLVNGVAHGATDWVTSRVSGFFYRRENWHLFFVTIGFDQFLHVALLLATLGWLS